MEVEKEYYSDNTRVSNSSLGWFEQSPLYFYKRLNNLEQGEDVTAFRKGTMIHMFILQPDEFWLHYQILDFEIPKSDQQKDFAIKYIQSDAPTVNLKAIEAFKASYVIKGMSEDKIASESLKLALKLKRYIKYLRTKDNKVTISWSEYILLKQIKENVEKHKLASKLLLDSTNKWCEAFSEFHIDWTHPGGLKCKSLLDRFLIDEENKTIYLIDIKTTNLFKDFADSVKKYSYIRQMSFYWMAIFYYMKQYGINLDNWEFKTYIVAMQLGDAQIKVFEINPNDLNEEVIYINKLVDQILWHISKNKWDYTMEYYENDGSETLRLW